MSVPNEILAKFAQKIAELTGLKYSPKEHGNDHISHYLENDKGGKVFIFPGYYNENKVKLSIDNNYLVLNYDPRAYDRPKMETVKKSLKINLPYLSFGFTVTPENWEKSAIRASKCEIFAKLSEYHQGYQLEQEKTNEHAKKHQNADLLADHFRQFSGIYPKNVYHGMEISITIKPEEIEKIQDLNNFIKKWYSKDQRD